MNRGDIVLVRTSGDRPNVRRIWEPEGEKPAVCFEDYWVRWERNGVDPVCTRVPRPQVYAFDAALVRELEQAHEAGNADHLAALWTRAAPV